MASRRASIAALAVALLVTGCGFEQEPEPGVGSTEQEVNVENGLTLNGLELNGLKLNGLVQNGIRLQGIRLQGIRLQGIRLQGVRLQGIRLQGLGTNGIRLQGLDLNGVRLQGVRLQGIRLNGVRLQGVRLQGVRLQGVRLQGLTLLGATQDGASMTAEQEANTEITVRHLVACALGEGDSVEVQLADGSYDTMTGAGDALAPDWKHRELNFEEDRALAACLMSIPDRDPALDPTDPLTIDSEEIALSDQQLASLRTLYKYMIECALPEGQCIDEYGAISTDCAAGDPGLYHGAYGLAPRWSEIPSDLDPAGDAELQTQLRYVSACLAARTNANGQHVMLSIRGAGIPVDESELRNYSQREGAFWADFFGAAPYVRACSDDAGISGRVCAADSEACGFDVVGSCADHCQYRDDRTGYADCDAEPLVLTTYLNTRNENTSHSDLRRCAIRDGRVWCWGGPWPGNGLNEIAVPPNAVQVVGGDGFSCSRHQDGSVYCWGYANDSLFNQFSTTNPTEMTALGFYSGLGTHRDVVAIDARGRYLCTTWSDSKSGCSDMGLLIGGADFDNLEFEVEEIGSVFTAASYYGACSVGMGGSVLCRTPTSTVGTPIHTASGTDLDNVEDLCMGDGFGCASTGGDVYCWGTPYGATAVPMLSGAQQISCGSEHVCAVASNEVRCWGANDQGQLGRTGASSAYDPVEPELPTQISQYGEITIGSGDDYTCIEWGDGAGRYCWGNGTPTPYADALYADIPWCGNGVCDASDGENWDSCRQDCWDQVGTTRACGNSTGACEPGTETLVAVSPQTWSSCTGAVTAVSETCNGLDDDCDGETDEGLDDLAAGTSVGECNPGRKSCVNGSWEYSADYVGPTAEVCDGLDNDCDGEIDDDLWQYVGTNTGECNQGRSYCDNGVWGAPQGYTTWYGSYEEYITPTAETCDGLDNDCDGAADDGLICETDTPYNLSPDDYASTGAFVSMSWSPPVNMTYGYPPYAYEIEVQIWDGYSWSPLTTRTVSSFPDPAYVFYASYSRYYYAYRVRAYDYFAGWGGWSDWAGFYRSY